MAHGASYLRSIRKHLVLGVGAVVLLAGGVGGWAASTELSGAIIAPGQIVVDSNVKKVQHQQGGIVGELHVRDGQRVEAGEIVLRLDDTQTRAQLLIVSKYLDDLEARRAREEAERDGLADITFPQHLLDRMDDPDVARAVNGERKQFEDRLERRETQKRQFRERVAQLKEEITGYEAQIASKDSQLAWIEKELKGVNDLWRKDLIPYTRVTTLEREKERLSGERGQLVASVAQTKGKITETEIQIRQIDSDLKAEVSKDLGDIRPRMAELAEKKVAAEDQLKRVDIRSPQRGFVHQLAVHTVGGVVSPAEPIMLIVPDADALSIEAKVQPQDIDQLKVGQKAALRFSAFNQRTTPEIDGEVDRLSADVTQDQKTGTTYYTVRIRVPEREMKRLEGLKLVPGMPVEAFIQTQPRTVMSYVLKPFTDQMSRAFRETD